MSYHIVNIDSPQCSLSCRDGQLTCKDADGRVRTLPMEDIASILITSFSAHLHSHLLLEAARHGVALIICDSFKPTSLLLPANRATDTLLTRAQVDLTDKLKSRLWQKTVDAKCANQLSLAEHLAPDDPQLGDLNGWANSRHCTKEAVCAKYYWAILARALNAPDFERARDKGGLNHLLNYGYAVLLSTVLQKLFALGLDPTFGIHHAIRERATPLAYDLMEPFRPCVDWRVVQWVRLHPEAEDWAVTKEFRVWVTAFPVEKVPHLNLQLEVQGCIESVLRGFRKAMLEQRHQRYKPWTQRSSKWVG
tara:strand:- start:392 stop:1312 length:921 start_codon:yes stop_codon:yes gene_type:complete